MTFELSGRMQEHQVVQTKVCAGRPFESTTTPLVLAAPGREIPVFVPNDQSVARAASSAQGAIR